MKNKKKIKVLFLLPSLVAGGAERVISFVSQHINKEVFEPTLLIAGSKKDSVYDVKNIDVIYFNKSRILTALPSIIKYIFLYKPDIVVSSIAHVNIAMSSLAPFFKNTKFIGREATILSKRKNEKKKRKWSAINLIKGDFKNLDMIICQSEDMAEDMILNYNVPKQNVSVINNPISNLSEIKKTISNSKIKKFVTVGRLTEVKGHERILKILSKLEIPFEYTIIGSGDLKDKIFEKAKVLSINEYITHIPYTIDVNKYLKENDMFLQGSFVEGFPNALLESCVVGTPVIAFDAPGGTKEIIEDGINGFLVNNEEEFLERLKDNRDWNSEKIRQSVYIKFNKAKIIGDYEQLFLDILKQK